MRFDKTMVLLGALAVVVVATLGAVINGHSGSASDPSTPWRTATHGDTLTGEASFSAIWINTGATGGTVTETDPSTTVDQSACKPVTEEEAQNACWPSAGTPLCRVHLEGFTDATAKWIAVRACQGATCSAMGSIVANAWPRPTIANVERDSAARATKITGTNFKPGATVRVGNTAATVANVTPTQITLAPPLLTGLEVTVRNASEEVGGCAPFARWNAGVGVPEGRVRLDGSSAP